MRISVVGLGTNPAVHLTLGAIRHLRNAKRVLYFGHSEHLFDSLAIYNRRSLEQLYVDGIKDTVNYNCILNAILSEAREWNDLAVALPGHPLFGVTLIRLLKCALAGIPNDVLIVDVGISSFDTMLSDRSIDPLEPGTLLLDVNRMLTYRPPLNPNLNVFLYHICSVGVPTVNRHGATISTSWHLLKSYLLNYYSPSHKTLLLRSADEYIYHSEAHCATVETLERILPYITYSSSLLLPAGTISDVDVDYLRSTCSS